MDSLVLQTAIGLIFVFATFAALTSVVTELIARYLGLRGEYLLRGIQSLVDGGTDLELDNPLEVLKKVSSGAAMRNWRAKRREAKAASEAAAKPGAAAGGAPADAAAAGAPAGGAVAGGEGPPRRLSAVLLGKPVIGRSSDRGVLPEDAGTGRLTRNQRRKLPSYVSSRAFASAVFDLLVGDAAGKTGFNDLERTVRAFPPDHPLRGPLLSLLLASGQSVTAFRHNVERWYDDHMARVSGWYKRHVRWISLAIGAALVLLLNVNAIEITRALYTDQALRGSVVSEATKAAQCGDGKEPAQCLQEIRDQIDKISGSGLPIGWRTVPQCRPSPALAPPQQPPPPAPSCDVLERHGLVSRTGGFWADLPVFLLALLGWGLMVLALLPGARFWFDALSRLGSLRSTGPKPPPAPTA